MTLPVPELDDRRFVDLVREARDRIRQSCPEWTDLSVHDPGTALLEAFAYLTEVLIYRLNRLPEKAYVEFLNLLGVRRHPPAAAWAELVFRRTPGGPGGATGPGGAITVPAGTRVTAKGADQQPVVFTVTESTAIPAGAEEVRVRAHHCEVVAGELLGVGTGLPGQVLRTAKAPIVTTTEAIDLMVGVEAPPEGVTEGMPGREFGNRTFEIWRRVPSFADVGPHEKVYVVDRSAGTVSFAPALDLRDAGQAEPTVLAAVPPPHREIRAWYRLGGGQSGNVSAGALTTLRDPVPGVTVSNPDPARGGRPMESLEQAVGRGPYELFALQRAVTARDFELLACAGSGSVARAKAFTRSAMWSFAKPGEVEVVLVPDVEETARPNWRLPEATLVAHQSEEARLRTQADLDSRRALGTGVVAGWARHKSVAVKARVVVGAQEDPDGVRRRIEDRLYQTISPLPTDLNRTGWTFGEQLRPSNVYRLLEQAEPGVRYVDEVRFVVDEAPDAGARSVAADNFQSGTWYAGCGEIVYRSTNDRQGWEAVGRFPGDLIRRVVPAPAASRPGITRRPGHVVAVSRTENDTSAVRLSRDLGENWQMLAELEPAVADVAWIDRDGIPALLLATDAGLYELVVEDGAVPLQIQVEAGDLDRGFYAVRSFVSERGVVGVAVAAQARYGVYLSTEAGRPGTYRSIGLSGVDVRTLAVQLDGPATVLWAGAGEADSSKPGQGALRARLFEANVQWQKLDAGWTGGTCREIAFAGRTALAATQSGGVLRLDTTAQSPQWQTSDVNSGLPLRDRTRFDPVETIATSSGAIVAGGGRGIHSSADGVRWNAAANRETRAGVTVPETWLLCSGEHNIEVVREDATSGD